MRASIRLGKILGVPIGLHWSWFLVFIMVSVSLSAGYFLVETPELSFRIRWGAGILTSLLFFISVLAHELGHAVLALRNQIPVRSISLFLFGGVAQIGQEPPTPGVEFRVALAGPLTSLGLAGFFALLGWVTSGVSILSAPSEWLARVNLALAAFNMIPGFPLDGGRVLRSIFWHFTRNYRLATRLASTIGMVVALGFMAFGIYRLFNGDIFNGLWIVFIGWFLQNAASSSRAYAVIQHRLDGIKVAQVMSRDLDHVPGHISLAQLVKDRLLPNGRHLFLVGEAGKPRGLLTLNEIAAIPRQDWDETTAEQIMTPWSCMIHIPAEMGLWAAINLLESANLNQAPVVQGEEITGLISKDQVMEYMEVHSKDKG